MLIKRVQVEEGFLHGLDLQLGHGLTVLIGARGSGKTSIIELIRFCLAARPLSEAREQASRQQVTAVLGSGKVTMTLELHGEEVTVSRSADDGPRYSVMKAVSSPLVLSQNEIEYVGRDPASRLRLLDGFAPSLDDNARSDDAKRALISSLTVELRGVLSQLRDAEDELAKLAAVSAQLAEARQEADRASSTVEQTAPQRARLQQLQGLTAAATVRLETYGRAITLVRQELERVRSLRQGIQLDAWPAAAATEDPLTDVRTGLAAAARAVAQAESQYVAAMQRIGALQQAEQQQHMVYEDEARTLRTHIDSLSEGAGVLMKRVSDLVTLEQRADALDEHVLALRSKGSELKERRDGELDTLDALRESRINVREQAAAFLNRGLGPRIRVTVNRFGSMDRYTNAIAEALRGSGLQYNVLAPELARSISPRELALAAERGDAAEISTLTKISMDRAQRVASHLRDVGTEQILTSPLEDTVQLALLDGGRYKPAEDLSVGQRCTAVLPIILSHTERVLLVDQPEDNLDNSFVADTLVKVLRNRPETSQLIFATHNPNIPVLGEANCVVFLTSDGKRGEVANVGVLDDSESVRAITEIMEGGRKAFETRAAFYAQD
ncbi:MAG: AAA family ATPase [Mycobacteriales bacterium]